MRDYIQENFKVDARKGQNETIEDVIEAFESGYKNVIVDADVGSGKSYIAVALARYYNNSYIYTPQKLLQDQYGREFPEIPVMKGRSNYPCELSNRTLNENFERSASNGLCIMEKINYYKKRWDGQKGCYVRDKDGAFVFDLINDNCPGGRFRDPATGFLECHRTKNAFRHPIKSQGIGGFGCYYLENKTQAVKAPITILNYDYGLYELNFAGELNTREIALHDEAHNIEQKIMNFVQLEIPLKTIQAYTFDFNNNNVESRLNELDEAIDQLHIYIDSNLEKIDKLAKRGTIEDDMQIDYLLREINKTKRLIDKIERTIINIESEPQNWLSRYEDGKIIFKPILIHDYAQKYLLSHTRKNVFLSGTIISPVRFAEWLGLEKVGLSNKMGHFPKEIRPIELCYAGAMGRKTIDETMVKAIPIIKKILDIHKDQKGIIHTNSFKITNMIKDCIDNDRLVYHDGEVSQYDLIHNHINSNEPKVLVSPSVKEGLDLKDELGRFQIVAKIPYPNLGDAQILARKNIDELYYDKANPVDYKWYTIETVKGLIQSFGRIVRHKNDFGKTYILDKNFQNLYGKKSVLPLHVQQAIMRGGKFESDIEYQINTEKNNRVRLSEKIEILNYIRNGNNTLNKIYDIKGQQGLESYNSIRVTIQDLLADEHIEVI